VKNREGKDDSPAGWRLICGPIVLGEADFAAPEIAVQIYRYRIMPMRRDRCVDVAVWPEMSTILGGVAADDIALYPSASFMKNNCSIRGSM
jgi:hypothetical protein